ncbi:MAG: ParB/RepB/Spo0J family partition protein [Pseudomonadota bacterium]
MSKEKKGVTLDDMLAGLDDLPVAEKPKREAGRSFKAAAHESTALDPKMLQGSGSTRIKLPASKSEVVAKHAYLDPRKCKVSGLNLRNQSLLSESDPAVQQLAESIKKNGQLEPVLVRPINDPEYTHEVIYGSRRRFCAELLTKESGELVPLSAWVSHEIADVDAQVLARIENKDREALSPWEYAQHIQAMVAEGWTQESIAAQEGIGRSTVAEYATVAALPEGVLKVFVSPSVLTLRDGTALARELKKSPEQALKIVNTAGQGSVASSREILKLLKQTQVSSSAPKPRKPIAIKNADGKLVARISASQTKKKHYKIDLYDAEEELVQKLKEMLEKA